MRSIALASALLLSSPPHAHQFLGAPVPFVGCASDGQLGPLPAPEKDKKPATLPSEAGVRLAWYQAAQGQGVLAPRGWHCFGTYGSSGSTLYVSPQRLTSETVFSQNWKGLDGPAVQLSDMSGGTSGRFAVADAISRVFPAFRGYISQQDLGTVKLPDGPFPADALRYRNDHAVEYTTPAHKQGLGTSSRLIAGDLPIFGVDLLTGADTDLVSLSVRLPAGSDADVRAITLQVEQANTAPPHKP